MKLKLNQKILSLAVLAGLGLAAAAPANAATANGTVTITGAIVVTCTINSPTVDFPNVPFGAAPQLAPATIEVTCPPGVTYSLSSPMNQPLTIGLDTTSNFAEVTNLAGTNGIPAGGPLTGTGNGSAQTQPLMVKIFGTGAGSSLVSYGAISGTLPLTLSY